MKRREFITLIGGAAATWPLAVRAQQPSVPVVGFMSTLSPESISGPVAGFHQGLRETGYREGQNVTIEYRWAQGHYDRLPELQPIWYADRLPYSSRAAAIHRRRSQRRLLKRFLSCSACLVTRSRKAW